MKPTWASDDGRAVLYNADCLDVLPHLSGVDCVITDPPYRHAHMDGGGFATAREFYAGGKIDFISDFDFTKYAAALFSAPLLVASCSRDLIRDYANECHDRGYVFDLHVWYKTNAIPFTCNTFKSDLEYVVVAWKGTKRLSRLPQHELSKMYQSATMTGKLHPTEKPVALMTKYLKAFGEAAVVLDPFMGSGTTGVAALRLGRNFIGMEIDDHWFTVAQRRIQAELDQKRLAFGAGT